MSYQDELQEKLSAVHAVNLSKVKSTVDVTTQVGKVLQELDREFEFSQYDLEESDILRTLKILNILKTYDEVFTHSDALKLFYTLSRVDAILPKQLQEYMRLPPARLKTLLNTMARHGLLFKNEDKELELTLEGKSLATRIGVDIYL